MQSTRAYYEKNISEVDYHPPAAVFVSMKIIYSMIMNKL